MQSYLTAEISAVAVAGNLALLRGLLDPATRICAVVKADCYGHSIDLLAPVLAKAADWLAVTTPDEGLHLRDLGYRGPVLMFFAPCPHEGGRGDPDTLAELTARGVTLTLVSADEVAQVADAARRAATVADVHVKIDTGMTRSGVLPDLAPALVAKIGATRGIRLTGLFTHFAAADEPDKSFTLEQLGRFMAAVEACGRRKGLVLHAANSAATIDAPETHLDMVRPGIALYGYQPSNRMRTRLPLRPALRLWAPLMQVKSVPAGSRCGYGLTHKFDRPATIGLVPIGYGDGYFRSLSNRATMRVRGADVPICGRVSMDQVILDLTDVPDARVGDQAEIMSPEPADPHSVENLAKLAGTIPYEITCQLTGPRVRRVLVDSFAGQHGSTGF